MPGLLRQTPLGNGIECGRLSVVSAGLVKSTPAPFGPTARLILWVVFGITLIAVLCARIRLAGLPLERDEGEYAYMGQILLQGVPLYKLAYSMKFPGTAHVYAVLMSIFGQTATGIHVGLLFSNLLTVALIVLLGRQLIGELGGVAAGASYSVLSLMPHVLGQAAHATHFVVLFAIAGNLVLLRAVDRQSRGLIFGSGCLFGLAVLMKQPGIFFALFGAVYLLWKGRCLGTRAGKIFSRSLLFGSGVIAPVLLTAVLLWTQGVFGKFWFWTVRYAAEYGNRVSWREGAEIFLGHFVGVVGTAWPFWALAVIGLIGCLTIAQFRPSAIFVVPFAVFSGLAVCPGLYFRPHYFILFLPAVAFFAAIAVVAVAQRLEKSGFGFVAVLGFASCLAYPLFTERDFFFERSIVEANRMVNGTNPFPESVKIADFLRSESDRSDTIAVLGSEPQIYFYAHRRSATGYIYTYSLMEPQPYARQMQEEMIREIEMARPKFLVLVVISKSWLAGADSNLRIFQWAESFCDANYDEIGLVNISDEGSEYYLSRRPPNVKPTPEHILIYRRKA